MEMSQEPKSENQEIQIRTIEIPMDLLIRAERIRRYSNEKGDGVLVRALELGLRILESDELTNSYREGKMTQSLKESKDVRF